MAAQMKHTGVNHFETLVTNYLSAHYDLTTATKNISLKSLNFSPQLKALRISGKLVL
ncbi:protein of unknown function [Moritella yayanosii]|uniref:Uncharacterized protein n=1 Tax=Moritella yayanosii TaxID=69539 RepID=A0A330LIW3_9GAMM|nr:protein of unknown function [Moritella yayanosii]